MSINKLIAKVNKMMPFEISILNDPVIVSSSKGTITDINKNFTATFGWKRDELVGQNAHQLIPSKFIRKSSHDQKINGYSFGNKSPIIGKARIVPVSSPDDKEILATIKIIPIKFKKEFCFMVLFNVIDFERRFGDFDQEFKELKARLRRLKTCEEFREDRTETSTVVKNIYRLFGKELEAISDFIVENSHSTSVVQMCKHFLLEYPIGKLKCLLKEMESLFDYNTISYLNITCLRIIFPSLVGRVDMHFLNSLKVALYEDKSSEDTS